MPSFQCLGCTRGPCLHICIDPEYEPGDKCNDKNQPENRAVWRRPGIVEPQDTYFDGSEITIGIPTPRKIAPLDTIRRESMNCEGCQKEGCTGCSTYNYLSNLDPSTGDE